MNTKRCYKCKEEKTLEEFSIDRRNKKNGRHGECRQCAKKWRENNAGSVKASQKKERDRYNESEEYRESAKQRDYEWRLKNWGDPNKRKEERKIKRLQKEKELKLIRKERQYRKEHITPFIKRVRTYIWSAFKYNKLINNKEFLDALGCDLDTLKEHIESQFYNGMTWGNKGGWHIDHVIPFKTETTLKGVKKLCHYKNMQPMWEHEHKKKSLKEKR